MVTLGLRYGAEGIALSYSLVTLLTALWLLLILHRRKFPLDLPKLGLSIGRMILASAVMSGVMISLMTMISLTVFSLMGLILVAVGVYAGTMYLLRAPELRFWRPTV